MNTFLKTEGNNNIVRPKEIWKKTLILTFMGGLAFWLANFGISLTSIAAEYRTALSIAYLPMLVEALLGGLLIGFCVSFVLFRFFGKIPGRSSILKSLVLSLFVLIIATVFLGIPSSFLTLTDNALRYFLIGVIFNILRISALGIVIGYLYRKFNGGIE
jgi:hypothetical protein